MADSTSSAPPISSHEDKPPPGRIRRVLQFVRRLGPAGVLGVAAVAMPPVGAAVLLGVMPMLADRIRGTAWGPPVCVVTFAVAAGFALLPTLALSVFAGWVFGFPVGYATALVGFGLATLVTMFIARRTAGGRVTAAVDERPRWRAVHRALLHSGGWRTFWIVALLRAPTVPPFTMTTVALASVRVRTWPLLLGSMVGVAPRTAAYVYLAARAERLDFDQVGHDVWLLILSGVAALLLIAVLTILARRALRGIADSANDQTAAN